MDIDIAFWLLLAVAITGLVYLLDIVVLKPKRLNAVETYRSSATKVREEQVAKLLQEPVWVEYPKSFFPVLALVLVLRSFLVEPFTIPSASMMPTLLAGDYILVNKFAYGLRLPVLGTKVVSLGDPKPGDVLVFKYPERPNINYIKRVIGVPGDVVEYKNKHLWVNGRPVDREEVSRLLRESRSEYKEKIGDTTFYTWIHHRLQTHLQKNQWQVPEGHYFVMGDNRDNSKDSRFWGYVPDDLVVGRAFAIWIHRPQGEWPSFSRNGLIN